MCGSQTLVKNPQVSVRKVPLAFAWNFCAPLPCCFLSPHLGASEHILKCYKDQKEVDERQVKSARHRPTRRCPEGETGRGGVADRRPRSAFARRVGVAGSPRCALCIPGSVQRAEQRVRSGGDES